MANPIEVFAIGRDAILRYEDTVWSLSTSIANSDYGPGWGEDTSSFVIQENNNFRSYSYDPITKSEALISTLASNPQGRAEFDPTFRYIAQHRNPGGGDNFGLCIYGVDDNGNLSYITGVANSWGGHPGWSPSGQYIAIANWNVWMGQSRCYIYSFDGINLTYETHVVSDYTEFYGNFSLDWLSNSILAAVGQSKITVWAFDSALKTLIQIDSVAYVGGNSKVKWRPGGNYLAAISDDVVSGNLTIYSWNGANLAVRDSIAVQHEGLCWNDETTFFSFNLTDAKLVAYTWDGISIDRPGANGYAIGSLHFLDARDTFPPEPIPGRNQNFIFIG